MTTAELVAESKRVAAMVPRDRDQRGQMLRDDAVYKACIATLAASLDVAWRVIAQTVGDGGAMGQVLREQRETLALVAEVAGFTDGGRVAASKERTDAAQSE